MINSEIKRTIGPTDDIFVGGKLNRGARIKSKSRVRDHGEVFTPDFIIDDMLDLVKNETDRIESRFLEPACGDGNFLIKVLERKLRVVKRVYKKSQFDYERNAIIAVSSIYGVELLDDNARCARERIYNFFLNEYEKNYTKKINNDFLKSVRYVLNKNILQGNALTLKDREENPITFSEWSPVNGIKIKRRDFIFKEIMPVEKKGTLFETKQFGDDGKEVFIPKPIKEYPPANFLELHIAYE